MQAASDLTAKTIVLHTVCLSDELRKVKNKLVLGVDVKQRQVADAPGASQRVRHAQLVDLAHVTNVQLKTRQ